MVEGRGPVRPSLILPLREIVVSAGKDTLNVCVEVVCIPLIYIPLFFPPLPTNFVLNTQIALHQ